MNKKITFLIVLYKQLIEESETIKSFLEIRNISNVNIELFIWDNSPEIQDVSFLDSIFSKTNFDFVYKHSSENLPLSKVYNYFFSERVNCSDYLCVFDQDSKFDIKLIEEIAGVVSSCSPMLILPTVSHKGVIVSPSKIYWMKGCYLKTVQTGFIPSKNISAINSGMIINADYIREYSYHYDSRLLNYCTDDYFMKIFRQNGHQIYVLNYLIEHDLSLSTLNNNSSTLKNRYRQMLYGWLIVHSGNKFESFLSNIYVFLHKAYMALRYRDIEYIFLKVK